jgi:nucleoside-diphosphate-sugar epimerase
MRVLMTGSHGFVGTNLVESLSSEHEIIRWDVRSDDELPECDVVIHLAGKAHDTKNVSREEVYYEVNTELTKKIFDAFLKTEARKFIFFSSIKAQDGDTAYAKSKKVAEEYICGKFRDECLEFSEKKVYILRPCMIHGKGVKGNLPLLFKFVKRGLPWPLAAFENQRSYASMGNVCYVVSELLRRNVESGTYNICDDEPISTNALIRLMSECLGMKCRLLRVPKCLIKIEARVGDYLHLPLTTERVGKLTENYVVDNNDIKRALGISSMPIKAMDGLKATIESLVKS